MLYPTELRGRFIMPAAGADRRPTVPRSGQEARLVPGRDASHGTVTALFLDIVDLTLILLPLASFGRRMKIRHPLAIKSAAFVLSLWLRTWMCMSAVREQFDNPETNPRAGNEKFIYLMWHETIIAATAGYASAGIPVLISQHRDGELITQILRYLGGDAVRGSSTRGGDKALRHMLDVLQNRHLAITPDGPKGPRREMQLGPVYLASRAKIRLVPMGLAAAGAWRAKSWDRLMVPKPLMPIYVISGDPIEVPEDLPRSEMEPYRLLCERRLREVQELAEAKAAGKSQK